MAENNQTTLAEVSVLPIQDVGSLPQGDLAIVVDPATGTVSSSDSVLGYGGAGGLKRLGVTPLASTLAEICTPEVDEATGRWRIGGQLTEYRAVASSPYLYIGEDDGCLYARTPADNSDGYTDSLVFDFGTIRDHIYRRRLSGEKVDADTGLVTTPGKVVEAPAGTDYILTTRGNNTYVLARMDDLKVRYADLTEAERKEFGKAADEAVAKLNAEMAKLTEALTRAETAVTNAESAVSTATEASATATAASEAATQAVTDANAATSAANTAAVAANTAADRVTSAITDIAAEKQAAIDAAAAANTAAGSANTAAGKASAAATNPPRVSDTGYWEVYDATAGEYITTSYPAQGPQGAKGDQGDPGAKGDKGDQGDTGAQGIQGEKGEKGDTGATGPQGETGPKGDKGDPGEQGPQGIPGKDGTMTFEDLTEEQKASLKGDKGEKGDPFTYADFTADQLAELVGPTGPAGPAGADGKDGKDGSNATVTREAVEAVLTGSVTSHTHDVLTSLTTEFDADPTMAWDGTIPYAVSEKDGNVRVVYGHFQSFGIEYFADKTHTHSASDITSGQLAIARIPTGTTSSTVALGNHTHSEYAEANHTHSDYAASIHTHPAATATAAGFMSASDKSKLDAAIVNELPTLSTASGLDVLTDIATDPTGHIVTLNAESAGQLTLYPLDVSFGAYYVDDAGNYYNAGQVAGVWTFSQMSELHGIDSYPRLAAYKIADDVALPRIWTGTQAEYDALATKSSTTLYFITE